MQNPDRNQFKTTPVENIFEASRVIKNSLTLLNNYLPPRLKCFLKPYYRIFMPGRLHIVLWPTFRCNYKCSYCPYRTQYDCSSLFPRENERGVEEWLKVFSRLTPSVFFIAGGEPFLYDGIIELINEMPSKHELLGIVTNFSKEINVYKKIKRKVCFNISLHREYISVDSLLKKIKEIKKYCHVNVFIVATPENIPFIGEIKKLLSKNNIFLHVDPYVAVNFEYDKSQLSVLKRYISSERDSKRILKLNNFEKKICSAGRNYINILPDGQVYTCAGGMNYTFSKPRKEIIGNRPVKQFKMGNIFDENFKINNFDIECALPCLDFCDHDYCIIKMSDYAKSGPK